MELTPEQWALVPDWANYVAMDKCGHAFAFANEPEAFSATWDVHVNDWKIQRIPTLDNYGKDIDWRDSLVRRPQ